MFELTQLLCEWCKFLIEHDLSQKEKEIANFMVGSLKQTCRNIECKNEVNVEELQKLKEIEGRLLNL